MRLLGSHFVLGQTIEEALSRAGAAARVPLFLRHARRGRAHRGRRRALFRRLRRRDRGDRRARRQRARCPTRPGISVKLSALHPRYEAISRERVLAELTPRVLELARAAKRHDLNFTVDAEEADRLELSLDVIGAVLADPSLAGWDGFGLAVQAYQKRAGAVIDWLDDAARALGRRLMVRLVKGAYWDTEVKRAQERGLADYPVFTRKAMTDLSYMACARQAAGGAAAALSAVRHPQRADRRERDRGGGRRRGLRVPAPARHGRGALRGAAGRRAGRRPAASMRRSAAIAICSPIWCGGCWRTAPTRRSSSVAADPNVPVDDILQRPQAWIADAAHARHPHIPLPRDLYGRRGMNSAGVEFGDRAALRARCVAGRADGRDALAQKRTRRAAVDRGAAIAAAAAGASPPGTRRRSQRARRGARARRRSARGRIATR